MPDNFFDQYDDQEEQQPAAESNYFDQFDAGSVKKPAATKARGLGAYLTDFVGLNNTTARITKNTNELNSLKTDENGGGLIHRVLRDYADTIGVDPVAAEKALDLVNPLKAGTSLMEQLSPEFHKKRMEDEQVARTARKKELEAQIAADAEQAKVHEAGLGAVGREVASTLGSIDGDPSQVAPTLGGVVGGMVGGVPGATAGASVGSIPMAQHAYDGAYVEAKEKFKATDEEAKDYAYAITGVQMGTEGIGGAAEGLVIKGGAKLLGKKIAKKEAEDMLLKRIRGRIARTAGGATIEAVENVAGEAGSDAVRETMEKFDMLQSDEAQAALATANRENEATQGSRYKHAAAQGFIAGAAIAAPVAVGTHAGEVAQRKDQLEKSVLEANANEVGTATKADTEVNLDIKQELDKRAQEKAKADAFTKAEQDRAKQEAADAQRKADEEEAGFRTLATEDAYKGKTRVERAGDSLVERVPIHPPAETTPEQVQAEREQAAQEEASRVSRVQQGKRIELFRKTRESIAKGEQKAAKATAATERAKYVLRQKAAVADLLKNNPKATDAELADMLEQRMAAPVAPQAAASKPAATTAPAGQTAAEEPQGTDASARELARKAGIKVGEVNPALRMAQATAERESPADVDNRPAFVEKAKKVVKALVRNNSNTAVDVQNLLHQRKMVLASNPESIGRDTDGAAEFDPDTGKMYVYLDRVDPSNAHAVMVAAVHEATHAGQFNTREGRSSVMRQVLGDTKYNAAHKAILNAAKSGNKLAMAAVEKARADTAARGGDDSNEHLEVLGYFAGEAANARQGLGRLGGVARDITAGTRNFMREKLGADLDLSLNDINAASQRVGHEVAKTKVVPQRAGKSLQMIMPLESVVNPPNASRVYTDPVDGVKKFVISDMESALTERADKLEQVLKGPVSISQILYHPELYDQIPSLKNVQVALLSPVMVRDGLGGQALAEEQRIELAPVLIEGAIDGTPYAKEYLRSILLHELQHMVQATGEGSTGGSARIFFKAEDVKILRARATAARQAYDAVGAFMSDLGERVPSDLAGRDLLNYAADIATDVQQDGEEIYTKHNISMAKAVTEAVDRLKRVDAKVDETNKKYFQDYLNIHGEREARFTEQNKNKSLEKLPVNPTAVSQEEGGLEGRNEDAHVTRRYKDGTMTLHHAEDRRANQSSRALSMAANSESRDENLKKWFGKSVAKDANGEPKTFYTGTSKDTDFSAFKVPKNGVWFTSDPAAASQYAVENDSMKTVRDDSPGSSPWALKDVNTKSRVFPVYLKAENPYVITRADADEISRSRSGNYRQAQGVFFDKLRRQGYDSAIWEGDVNDQSVLVILDSPTQIKSVNNSGEFSDKKSNILSMAQNSQVAPRENISAKERVTRVVNDGTRAQTHDIKVAENLDTRYRRALKKDLANPNDPALQEAVETLLTHIDNADPAKKPALWAAFKRRYPNLAPVLMDMRNAIDDNSREIVQQMLNTGVELTPAEVKQVTTVLSQQGRYLTRAYSAFQQRIGKKWADQRWKDFEATQPMSGVKSAINNVLGSRRRLTPAAKRNAEEVMEGIKWLETKFSIPDDATLGDSRLGTLEQMYEDHIGPLSRLSYNRGGDEMQARREAMVSALSRQRDTLTPEQRTAMATQAAKEILGLDERTTNISKMFSSVARDPGTLNEKKAVPEELRKLLGEIKDPAGRVLSTMATQSAVIARAGVFTDLLHNYVGELVLPQSRINDAGMREKFPVQLKGEQYGPLNSFYVTKEVANRLQDMQDTYYTWKQAIDLVHSRPGVLASKVLEASVKKVLAPITRTEKITGVVLSPANWISNLLGSEMSMLRCGNVSPSSLKPGYQTARDYIAGNYYNTTTDMLNDAIRYLNIEAVDVAEMQHVLANKLQDYLVGNESAGAIRQKLRQGWRGTMASYAMMDAWAKIANFHERIGVLDRYYKALGENKSMGDIKREAGDVTSFTNLSSERVHPFLRATEGAGVSKFVPYFAETLRTTKTNYQQAFIDLERAVATEKLGTPGAKKAASIMRAAANKRFLGNTLATLFMPAVFPATSAAVLAAMGLPALLSLVPGADDDAEKKRRMLSEFNRYQDLIMVGKDKDGNPIYYAASSKIDPIGPTTDFIRTLVNTDNSPESYKEIAAAFAELWIIPTNLKRLWAVATRAVVPEARINRIAPDAMEATREFMSDMGVAPTTTNKAIYLADSVMPGLLKAQDPKYTPKPVGDAAGVKALQYSGVSFETLNPKAALHGYSIASTKVTTDARSKFNDALLNASTLTEDKAREAVVRYIANIKDQHADDMRNVDSLRAWQYDDAKIEELLASAGYSKTAAAALVAGDNTVRISLKSLEQSLKSKKQGLTKNEIEKLEKRKDDIKQMLSDMSDELGDMGVEVTSK
jgi:hypothetical protein